LFVWSNAQMDYIEIDFTVEPLQPYAEVLTAELAEIGFESFVETPNGLLAYVQSKLFWSSQLEECIKALTAQECRISYTSRTIPAQNWNQTWEESFSPIHISDDCVIRAPFHEKSPGIKYDLVIEPKMSFGTGHHETTAMMAEELLAMKVDGQRVLDMGCGTSVLAILAAKKGASYVCAIDNDEWAYTNSKENCLLNTCAKIDVRLGDSSLLKGEKFNVILANINRNILLRDMTHYISSLEKGGILLMSGFFTVDVDAIKEKAEASGLEFAGTRTNNNWALARFLKTSV
jgi:ribosomal protein L11 methyltransferase